MEESTKQSLGDKISEALLKYHRANRGMVLDAATGLLEKCASLGIIDSFRNVGEKEYRFYNYKKVVVPTLDVYADDSEQERNLARILSGKGFTSRDELGTMWSVGTSVLVNMA